MCSCQPACLRRCAQRSAQLFSSVSCEPLTSFTALLFLSKTLLKSPSPFNKKNKFPSYLRFGAVASEDGCLLSECTETAECHGKNFTFWTRSSRRQKENLCGSCSDGWVDERAAVKSYVLNTNHLVNWEKKKHPPCIFAPVLFNPVLQIKRRNFDLYTLRTVY